MKKAYLCLIALVCIVLFSSGQADAEGMNLTPIVFSTEISEALDQHSSTDYIYRGQYEQPVYRLVTVHQTFGDGTTREEMYPMQVATVTYEYRVYVGKTSGVVRGGLVDPFPVVESYPDDRLAIYARHGDEPTQNMVGAANDGTDYFVQILGGYLTVTYNNHIYYNANYQLQEDLAHQVTENIAYAYSTTGYLSDLELE